MTSKNEVECLVEPTSSEETTTTTTTTTNNETEQQQEQSEEHSLDQNLIKHPLQNRWSLWYDYQSGKINQENWVDSLKKVITFDSVEDFWCVFNNLPNVSNLKQGSSYHLFKEDIEPKWEHESNRKGGKWVVMVKDKSRCDNQWLQSVMACVGETFDSSEDICGIVYNSRKSGDKISVWTKTAYDEKVTKDIGSYLKKVLEIDATITYTPHQDSIRSSKSAKYLYDV
ncbi:hypothetical protein CYY_003836 [Polysphondylium violaceum]|uniref:Eukaryotic translation initiation factor 4E n=1 Tax=Polysphondylium violaceum TaxID=133409 RepID=A0A8J4V0U3_9MYCE|nr:hypothetical protein CYY_003836 [Polysphondylium violaceum]